MKKYPRLDEMGVNNPQEIEKFLIYTTEGFDILRIIYDNLSLSNTYEETMP